MWFYRISNMLNCYLTKILKQHAKIAVNLFFHIITSRYVIFRTKAMHINSTHQCYVVVYDLPFDVMIHIVTIM